MDSSKFQKTEKTKDVSYNETKEMKKYLTSTKGVQFLSRAHKSKTPMSTFKKIDELIDFYTAWASGFPVRGNTKMSKYDFLKKVEDFCIKNNISEETGIYDFGGSINTKPLQ